MLKNKNETLLKRYLKRKISVSLALVVSFLITGTILFADAPLVNGKAILAPNGNVDSTTVTKNTKGIVIGENAAILTSTNQTEKGDLGFTEARNSAIVIGNNAKSGARGIVIGGRAEIDSGAIESIAIGTSGWGTATTVKGTQSIAIGANTIAEGDSSIVIGNDDLDLVGSKQATVPDEFKTDSFNGTKTIRQIYNHLTGDTMNNGSYRNSQSGTGAVAIGVQTMATGDLSTALGTKSSATGIASVAFGVGANASKPNSVAIGAASKTDTDGTKQTETTIRDINYKWAGGENVTTGDVFSIGSKGYERQLKNVAAGEVSATSTDAINGSQLYTVTDFLTNEVTHTYFHTNTGDTNQGAGNSTTNLGKITDKAGATGTNSITAGINTQATATNSVALGTSANSSATEAIAIGINSKSSGQSALALGTSSQAEGTTSVALGRVSKAVGEASIAIGNNAQAIKGNDLAFGGDTKAMGGVSTAIGNGALSMGTNSTSLGAYAISHGGTSTAIGQDATSYAVSSLAAGTGASSAGQSSISIGETSRSDSNNSLALGKGASVISTNATIIMKDGTSISPNEGNSAKFRKEVQKINSHNNSENSIALGNSATITDAKNAIVMGTNAKIEAGANNSIAIGKDINVTTANSVVLGSGSAGSESATTETKGEITTSSGDKIEYGTYVGAPTTSGHYVSVGASGSERQIKNVAAGKVSSDSTDAINGSQLYATNQIVGNLAGSVKNKLGGNAALSPDGNITMTNIANTNKDNIHDAIIAARTKVTSDDKSVTITEKEENGRYTYDLKVDIPKDKTVVVAGTNTTVDSETKDGTTTYTVNAEKTTVSKGSDAVTVTPGTKDANNVTDYTIDLSQITKDNIQKGVNAKNTVDTKGLTFTGDSGTTGIKKLGDTVAITGDANIVTKADANGIALALSEETKNKIDKAETDSQVRETVVAGSTNVTVTPSTTKNSTGGTEFIVDVAKDLNIGEKATNGKDGVDGSIGVNGKDGSGVVINGADGSIGLNGKDGANGLTIKGADGQVGVDGKDGETKTRIVYETTNPDGTKTTEEVATLNDGLKFTGNNETTLNKHKLNTTVKVVGERDDNKTTYTASESAKNNIIVEADGTDKLTVKLAKDIDLTENGSVKIGDTSINKDGLTINGGPSVNKDGINAGNKKITNVAAGTEGTDAVNLDQLNKAINDNKTKLVDGQNTTVSGTGSEADPYKVNVSDNLVLGKDGADGKDGSIEVNGKDGSSVVINGKDGSIGLTGPKGENGEPGASANISVKDGQAGIDGKDGETKTRIVYETKDADGNPITEEVATLNDGLKFTGNNETTLNKHKLNTTVKVVGERDDNKTTYTASESAKNNIIVEADGTDKLTVKLAKDIDLTENGSVKMGDTSINKDGLTINGGPSVNKDGINAGNKKITGVAAGTENTDAVNLGQLNKSLSENIKVTGDKNITVETKTENGVTTHNVSLNDTVTLGKDNNQVKLDGTTGTISVGDDPSKKVVINGNDGTIKVGDKTSISNGNATFDKIAINGEKGDITGLTNKDLNSPDFATSGRAATEEQLKLVQDNVNKNIENIDKNLTNKGLNFAANSGETVHKNLGETLTIKGSGTKSDDKYSSENIKTKTNTDGSIEIILDKDLKTDTIAVGEKGANGVDGSIGVNGKDGSGVVINGADGSIGLNGKDGANGLSIKGASGQAGVDGKDGETKTRMVYETKDANGNPITEEVATLNDGLNFMGDTGDKAAVKLNKQVDIVGGQTDKAKLSEGANIGVVSSQNGENGKLEIKLAKDLTGISSITLVGGKDKDGKDQIVTINVSKEGALDVGNKNITGVADGRIEKGSTDAINGSQLYETKKEIGDVINQHANAINNNSKRISKLEDRVNSGLANSAAMSTLEFQEIGINQAVVGAAVGTYRGNQAVAVGLMGAPTENIRVQAKVSVAPGTKGGNLDTMAGVGASWRFNLK